MENNNAMEHTSSVVGKVISTVSGALFGILAWTSGHPHDENLIQIISTTQVVNTIIISGVGAVIGGSLGFFVHQLMKWLWKRFTGENSKDNDDE